MLFNTPVYIEHKRVSEWLSGVEKEIRVTLAQHLADSVRDIRQFKESVIDKPAFLGWCDKFEAQVVVLAAQIVWSEGVESALNAIDKSVDSSPVPLHRVLEKLQLTLAVLAESVQEKNQPTLRILKLEHLIKEFVRQRTVTLRLLEETVTDQLDPKWLCQMRFYFDPKQTDTLMQLSIYMGNNNFFYGFEYLGVQDRGIQTPHLNRCYLAATQPLESRHGGSPFGPADQGKTRVLKALGYQLGRFVHVVKCDKTSDFQAMNRIFDGLCQV